MTPNMRDAGATLRSIRRCCTLPIAITSFALLGCDTDPVGPREPVLQSVLLIAGASLATRLSDPSVVVLHVGTETAYRTGHIPGARFVAYSAIAVTRDNLPFELADLATLEAAFETAGVSDGSQVVLYTDAGILQAARAFFTLDYLGHTRVSLLDGGLDTWKADGRPLSTETVAPARGAFTPRPRLERLVTADWIAQRLQNPSVSLIDVRPATEYSGDVPGSLNPPRPGHIPGARNLFWRDLLLSQQDSRLKDEATLRAMFTAAGAVHGNTVVAHCITGVLSSVAYFTARYLGYDVTLYDGSFLDWSRRSELPVAKCATSLCA
jgi:thiosulfate/3-mercaptopyruvate sulfurtransferase